jgi:hypothetical protein
MNRRDFFKLAGGVAASAVAAKIYILPPPKGWNISSGEAMFFLPDDHWYYRYTYRNTITGHVSDATPRISQMVHTFFQPDMDVVDIYRQISSGDYIYTETVGFKG